MQGINKSYENNPSFEISHYTKNCLFMDRAKQPCFVYELLLPNQVEGYCSFKQKLLLVLFLSTSSSVLVKKHS